MRTALANLTDLQNELLALLIQRIAGAIQPEKIICYGCRIQTSQNWGCFQEDTDTYRLAFDLLIITPDDEKRVFHEIIQIAEQQCITGITVSSITHKLTSVIEALQAGSHFFSVLVDRGVLLYDASSVPLPGPADPEAINFCAEKATASWDRWFGLAKRFYSLACHSFTSEWQDLVVLMLHQSVEHTCIALIRVFTSYRSNTHNLSRLLAMTENFSPLPSNVFPRSTREETELFNLLLNGYGEPRYKDHYSVTMEMTTILIDRVGQLQAIAEKLYNDRIEYIPKKEPISFPITANGIPTASH